MTAWRAAMAFKRRKNKYKIQVRVWLEQKKELCGALPNFKKDVENIFKSRACV